MGPAAGATAADMGMPWLAVTALGATACTLPCAGTSMLSWQVARALRISATGMLMVMPTESFIIGPLEEFSI